MSEKASDFIDRFGSIPWNLQQLMLVEDFEGELMQDEAFAAFILEQLSTEASPRNFAKFFKAYSVRGMCVVLIFKCGSEDVKQAAPQKIAVWPEAEGGALRTLFLFQHLEPEVLTV